MRYLMIIALSFCLGAALTLCPLPSLWLLLTAAALFLCGSILGLVRRRSELRLCLILLFCAFGVVFGTGYRTFRLDPAKALAGTEGTYVCEAATYSEAAEHGVQLEAILLDARQPIRLSVYLYTDTSLKPGDRFTAELTLRDSAADGEYYGYSTGCFLSASGSELISVMSCQQVPLRYLPRSIAHRLEESLLTCFPSDTVAYAIALTTGNRADLSTTEKSILQRAGIYHALALSGLHMSVLVGCLVLFRRKRRLRALIGIPLCIAFAVVTGASPSVVRAAVIQCLLLLAHATHRDPDPPTALSTAALLLILQNPWALMNWGAQLSFAAVIGLQLFGTRLYRLFCGSRSRRKATAVQKLAIRARRVLAASASATLAAMALTIPLMAVDFGYLSLVSLLTNLLCGWVVAFCFAGSLLTALLGLCFIPGASFLGALTAHGLRYIILVSKALSRLPFACLYTSHFYGTLWVLLLYTMLMLVLLRPNISRIIPCCTVVSGFAICVLLILYEGTPASFTAIDTGQGQCLLLRNHGSTVMIDCGGSISAPGKAASDYLCSIGEEKLDLLILTHYDSDHVNGVIQLLELTQVDAIVLPDADSPLREEIETFAFQSGTELYVIHEDTTVFYGGEELIVFAPRSYDSSNDSCLSILTEQQNFQILITGDLDAEAEANLLATCDLPDIDILVAGHHGSASSTSAALLRTVAPEKVVISVGANNRYGHPAEETLQRITAIGAEVLRTDQLGTFTLQIDKS